MPGFILDSWAWQTYTCVFSKCRYPTLTEHLPFFFFSFCEAGEPQRHSLFLKISIRVDQHPFHFVVFIYSEIMLICFPAWIINP